MMKVVDRRGEPKMGEKERIEREVAQMIAQIEAMQKVVAEKMAARMAMEPEAEFDWQGTYL